MYKVVALISVIIRSQLPNPYITWFQHQIYADLFNMIVGGEILHRASRLLSGCAYYKGIDDSTKGSIGYLVSYILLTIIITMIGKLEINYKLGIAIFLLIYLFLCILTSNIFRKDKIRIEL